MPNWLKLIAKIIAGLVALIILLFVAAGIYIHYHKEALTKLVIKEANKSLNGTLNIGNLEPSFFKNFPGISVGLENIELRDKRWAEHHHTLLKAKDLDVAVNVLAFLKGNIVVNHINIENAAIDLYTDSTGYSNASIFNKKSNSKAAPKKHNSSKEVHDFTFSEVSFTQNDQRAKKLFQFAIHDLDGHVEYPDSGWHAHVKLNMEAISLSPNTGQGSFLSHKIIAGELAVGYNENSQKISLASENFTIGGDAFNLSALFETGKKPVAFSVHVTANQIEWRHLGALLSPTIAKTFNQFNFSRPIAIKAVVAGSLGGNTPFMYGAANVSNNTITLPGGVIDSCSFSAIFTNNNKPGKGLTNENSAIRLYKMTGRYSHLPFLIDTGSITNLKNPVATGNFKSSFPIANLNTLFGGSVAKFSKGTADMDLQYSANVINLRLFKPTVAGNINLRNADINYVPRNLNLHNSSLSLHFVKDDLLLDHIRLQSGQSILLMEGRVNNFLNLYYDAPEKILLTWKINSPQINVGEFLGFLAQKQQKAARTAAIRRGNSSNIVDQLGNVLNKGTAEFQMRVAKIYYKKFIATDAVADLYVSGAGVKVNQLSVQHAGGSLQMTGQVNQGAGTINPFELSGVVTNVDIHEFLYAFSNFGLSGIGYQNLKGILSAQTQLKGNLTDEGSLVKNSINGTLAINLKNGALLNYKPLTSVGKYAFPFRNLNTITFPLLNGTFDFQGDQVVIHPLQLSSSVLNADIAGTYGFTKGTHVTFDIPLRDPSGDAAIKDKKELAKKRLSGIVLHLVAKDNDKGKLSIGWNRDHK